MPEYSSADQLYEALADCGFRICTDTRKIIAGSVFFALKGPNFNANAFAAKALQDGCEFAVVDDAGFVAGEKTMYVEDVLSSLQEVARLHRRRFSIPVLAITGSNAKTTTKELVHAVMSQKFSTLATSGNLNNHIGVPLTLLRLRPDHRFAIIEMGANHKGEIDALCRIAEPDYGLITNIGKAHLEGFGGLEGVKQGKSELYRYLAARGGKVFVNGDDEVLKTLSATNEKITYGVTRMYDVIGRDFSSGSTVRFKYTSRYGEKDWEKLPYITTKLTGGYNFINCLAAACVGHHFNISAGDVKSGLEAYQPQMNRSQLTDTGRNTVILDAYNANPNSMKVAIDNLAAQQAGKKMAILGDMFELGEFSGEEHRQVAAMAASKGFDALIGVGKDFSAIDNSGMMTFPDTDACRTWLQQNAPSGYLVLLKGSRGMKMESLLDLL